jgi:hypothetical protein
MMCERVKVQFLPSAFDKGDESASPLCHFASRERAPSTQTLHRRLGGPQSTLHAVKQKISAQPDIKTWSSSLHHGLSTN